MFMAAQMINIRLFAVEGEVLLARAGVESA